MEVLKPLKSLGCMFYMVSPNQTTFETVDEVPDYIIEAVPWFWILFWIETLLMKKRKKSINFRINDAFASLANGIHSEMMKVLFRGWKMVTYIYIYNNWRIVTLPWNSLWTWWIAFILVDFFYYWGHRASHEMNIFWAAHQVHHSSEDFNPSTALRQSIFQTYIAQIFYLVMALVIPPSAYLVHYPLNLLYQFIIHTELKHSLGPLEWILNTPSHHRVHHGRNRYCIDKNYGGTLIIWDRLFGTFEAEKEDVVYGITHPVNSFEPFYLQFYYFVIIWKTFWATKGWKNKLYVICKGPGWCPGAPWRGNIEDIPNVISPIVKYDPFLPKWLKALLLPNFFIIVWIFSEMALSTNIPTHILHGTVLYVAFYLSAVGLVLDQKMYASWLNFVVCALYIAVDYYFMPYTSVSRLPASFRMIAMTFIRSTYMVLSLIWLGLSLKNMEVFRALLLPSTSSKKCR